jgi:hypothetical protein
MIIYDMIFLAKWKSEAPSRWFFLTKRAKKNQVLTARPNLFFGKNDMITGIKKVPFII